MSALKVGRVLSIFVLFLQVFILCESYEIPPVTIQAFKPKGLRASIPSAPNIGLFVFQGHKNRAINKDRVGSISGEALQETQGRWVVEDPDAELKVGDVIQYYVFVSVDGAGMIKDNLSYTVTALEETPLPTTHQPTTVRPTTTPPSVDCKPTVTKVRGGSACAGQTIFEENFDTLNEDIWQIEQYIPVDHPEFPFVSYQRQQAGTVSTAHGRLRIAPTLQEMLPGFTNESIATGELNLFSGCTGPASWCSAQAWGASILPPVVSARITSKGFAFTYGTVHVRAKLPQGDWLYPEILLEPFLKNKYGSLNYASGVVRIAAARGNRDLNVGITELGNKVLYGGPIMDFQCRQYLINEKRRTDGRLWGDEFHVYSVNWTPDRITLLVDSEEWARIEPANGKLSGHFLSTCQDLPRDLLAMGSKMAPFDDQFYITLGVAAGGITEFRDDTFSGGHAKPWRNQGRKASFNFWQDRSSWWPTWSNAELLVDYVKVIAL